jgi:DNA-binding Lrp family transcriptional regulator
MTSTVAVQRAVLKSDLPATARHIMLTLAAIADFKTGAIPAEHSRSLSEIADATGLGRSTAARILNLLEASGWIERDRPEVVAARTEGAKTAYVLKIGGSPAAGPGLVPERDQVERQGSPTAGPGLVPQRDGGSPTAGRIRGTDLKVCTDPPSSTSHSHPLVGEPDEGIASPERTDVERICTRLADRIEANGSKRPKVTRRWRTAARLLLDVDGRTVEQVERAIDWCQADDFWRGNVLSMPKLRERYDQLRLAAQRNGARASPPVTTRHIDDLTPEQRAARNPWQNSVRASQVRGAS